MKLTLILATLLLVLQPLSSAAQDWSPIDPTVAKGYASCQADAGGYDCLALVCNPYRGLELSLLTSRFSDKAPDNVFFKADDGQWGVIKVDLFENGAGYRAIAEENSSLYQQLGDLIKLVQDGAKSITVVHERQFSVGTRGMKQAIEVLLTHCPPYRYGPMESDTPTPMASDELASFFGYNEPSDSGDVMFSHQYGWSMSGQPLAQGTASHQQCVDVCFSEQRCGAMTYSDSGLCTILSEPSPLYRAPGVTASFPRRSGLAPRLPAIQGPTTTRVEGLSWRQNDTKASYVARLRASAVPMGGDCREESALVSALASKVSISALPNKAVAGAPIAIGWTSSDILSQRIPAWIMVTADKPIRFAGDGFFGLMPEAIGPFGLDASSSQHRAYFPLFEGRDLHSGKLEVIPLLAGDIQLDIKLVSWHRSCQQEQELLLVGSKINVLPGASKVVIRDPLGKQLVGRLIEIPQSNRKAIFDGTVVQLLDSTDDTEMFNATADMIEISPTGRFLVLRRRDKAEVVDVLDGTKILDMEDYPLSWWNEDSFVKAQGIATTVLPRKLSEAAFSNYVSEYPQDNAKLDGVNIEHAMFYADYGWQLVPNTFDLLTIEEVGFQNGTKDLNGFTSSVDSAPRQFEAFGPQYSYSQGIIRSAFDKIGLVAPLDTDNPWRIPLGPLPSYKIESPDLAELKVASMQADSSQEKFAVPVLRGLTTLPPPDQGPFGLALQRFGVQLADEIAGTEILATRQFPSANVNDIDASQKALRAKVRSEIASDLAKSGFTATWIKPTSDLVSRGMTQDSCQFASYIDNDMHSFIKGGYWSGTDLEPDLEFATKFVLRDGRSMWVLRTRCIDTSDQAQENRGALVIFLGRADVKYLASYIVDFWSVGSRDLQGLGLEPIFGGDLQAKAVNDRYVLLYAPDIGSIMVFDLETRQFNLRLNTAWRGEFLKDVFLDTEMKYLIQLNTDGSFAFYKLAETVPYSSFGSPQETTDQRPSIYGRYIDDEIVIWTEDFQFDATEEGAAFVELRFSGEPGQHSLDQLEPARRVPGLMQAVLTGTPRPIAVALTAPPKLVSSMFRKEGRVGGLVEISGQTQAVEVQLYFDGRLSERISVPTGKRFLEFDVPFPPGARWAMAIAVDAKGQSSQPVGFDLGKDPTGVLPRTHFFGVGIDYYADPGLQPLNYAKSDVLLMQDTFEQLDQKTINLITNEVLVDRRASVSSVLERTKSILEEARSGDHIVLHFAGHGLQDSAGVFYLAGSGTDISSLSTTALNWSDFAKLFVGHDVRVTVLLDACHSGSAATGATATNDGAVTALQGTMPPGLTIIAAAKGRQTSGEDSQVGGGLFSTAAAKVMTVERNMYDSNGNGVLEAVEFYRGVKSLVTAQRGTQQTPWLARNQAVGENGLF